jgi:predicted RNase H-like nuclease (RuvC/YqgF family)
MIIFEFIAKNYHVNVMIKQKLKILWTCYLEKHIRKHEKHRDEAHRERHIHNKHRIETSIKNLIKRLSNLNELCSNLNESCSNLNELCMNLSQKIITLTWWSNKNERFFSYVIMKKHSRTRRVLYKNVLNIIFSTNINQKFNLTFVELE